MPHRASTAGDLLIGASAEHGGLVVADVPVRVAVRVTLVDEQPVLPAPLVLPGPDEHEATLEPMAAEAELQLAIGHRGRSVVGLLGLPGTQVPDDDVAPA